MTGKAFAERLLAELHAELIGIPKTCSSCGEWMEVRRSGGKVADLFWHCRPCNLRFKPDLARGARR